MTTYVMSKTQYNRWLKNERNIIVHYPGGGAFTKCNISLAWKTLVVHRTTQVELCGRCSQMVDDG